MWSFQVDVCHYEGAGIRWKRTDEVFVGDGAILFIEDQGQLFLAVYGMKGR